MPVAGNGWPVHFFIQERWIRDMSKKGKTEHEHDQETDPRDVSDSESADFVPDANKEATDAAEVEAMHRELKDLKQKLQDQQLRGLAELDNVRKRAEREVANSTRYGAERLLRDLLAVCDSLELGQQAATAPEATVASIAEGLSLTHRQLMGLLESNGVVVVDPVGEAFDPDFHEAVSVAPTDQVAANHVLTVMQKGYRLHDRVLRPARVVVAQATATTPRS